MAYYPCVSLLFSNCSDVFHSLYMSNAVLLCLSYFVVRTEQNFLTL